MFLVGWLMILVSNLSDFKVRTFQKIVKGIILNGY
jgi:hypothetical protein